MISILRTITSPIFKLIVSIIAKSRHYLNKIQVTGNRNIAVSQPTNLITYNSLKQRGNDNTNITISDSSGVIANSPGATITIRDDVANKIAKDIIDNPSHINEHYDGIKNILMNTHPYYSFVPSRHSGELIPIAKNKEAQEKCPLRIRLNFIPSANLDSFGGFKDALVDSYNSQTPISIDNIQSFEILIGDKLFRKLQANPINGTRLSAVINPQEFPPPRPVKIFVEHNEGIGFDYIELGLTKIDGNTIFLSNSKDLERTVNLEFIINLADRKSEFNFSLIGESRTNARMIYMVNKTVELLIKGNALIIKELKGDGLIKISGVSNSSAKYDIDFMDLLHNIVRIEDHFEIRFVLPELIDEQDASVISRVITIMETGKFGLKLAGGFTFVDIDSGGAARLVNFSGENNCLNSLILRTNEIVSIFGKTIDLGEVELRFPPVKISGIDKLHNELESRNDNELVNITFKLFNEYNNYLEKIYYRFISE